ncbi:MAG: farnesyl diphosphate synthase [Hydrogenophaga sp.]|uniref:polyprenyl synthetase family protein n=1 Tax=Hydrogenophaga sp. TaxID=1904254 RepID=UPI00277B0784|nr:farnesyl diphosphate synthase [Hydrogenophaga sp.]MDP2418421.1 polyprenyl synthetase family protein [Hydrogenophaga sp.]MDZ4189878.1 farnesyl diphosphate synthase [Hydrogenophaga sp.]
MTVLLSENHSFVDWRASQQAAVEQALSLWVSPHAPAGLGEAMRYAVLDGGKRLRPLLVLATSEAVSGSLAAAMRAACAVELIHAYSLVHDDMPCMDNDVLRRGKPTVHVRFGEAQALLAGDALQALAFELLVPDDDSISPSMAALLCRLLARSAGSSGMAGGQAVDLASVGLALDQSALEAMHRQKTGALLQASVMMGAATGHASAEVLTPFAQYGASLGLAFQVVDDILDVTADSATLGKTAGKDAAFDKPTFVSLLGLEQAQAYADRVLDQAHGALDQTGLPHLHTLHALADWVGQRAH